MKKFLLTLGTLFLSIGLNAQSITFTVSDGLPDAALRGKIENNLSALLTSFNAAYESGAAPDFSAVKMDDDASMAIGMLWNNMPFRCEEEMIVERILTTYSGFQVRNVPIELKADGGKTDYQELVIDMGKDGTVTRINLALQSHLYRNVMSDGSEVKDLRCRQMILDYVEQKTGRQAVIEAVGDPAPYNGESEYSINTDKAAALGFRFSRLRDWIYDLLDYDIACLAHQ